MRHRLLVAFVTVALAVTGAVPAAGGAAGSASGPAEPTAAAAEKKKSKKKSRSKAKCPRSRSTKGKSKSKSKRTAPARCKKRAKRKPRPGRPGTPAPVQAADLGPRDYLRATNLSKPVLGDVSREVVKLTAAGGTDLHVEVVRPKGATNLGVILEASPYHGTLYDRTGTRILPVPRSRDGKPVGLTGYFPQRGYAVVMMDLRGTGKSGGCLNHLGALDQADLEQVVEWAATQPWSNGRVGMVGHSYVGSTPVLAAGQNPKGLVTIVPSAGLASMYDHQFQHGVPWNLQFAGPIIGYSNLALDADLPPGVTDPTTGAPTGDDFGAHPQNTGCGFTNLSLNAGPVEQYVGQETDWHRERDARKEAIAWPGHVFLVHGVNDEAARIASMQWFTDRGGRAGDKTWIGQWDHGIGCCPNSRGMQWTLALHAWFDRQLLQRDVDTGPPVEAFLNNGRTVPEAISKREEIVTFDAWPPRQATPLTLGTGGDGTLVSGGAGPAGEQSFVGDPRGYLGEDTGHVDFRTAPAANDLMLVGVPALDLVVSTAGQRTDLIVNVLDESPGGEQRRITHFAMNPLLRKGIDTVTPVTPGERMSLQPPGWAMAHRLKAGHRLVLRVSASDPDHVPFGITDPQITVYGGPDGTTLRLPQIPATTVYRDSFAVGPGTIAASGTGRR